MWPVANPGEGPAALFLDQTEARRDEKKFFGDPPPPPPSPLISRSSSGTGDEQLKVKSLISRVACYADDICQYLKRFYTYKKTNIAFS